jgi:hypothetical protein
VNENLKRKRIFLEQENFDILSVLHSTLPVKATPTENKIHNSHPSSSPLKSQQNSNIQTSQQPESGNRSKHSKADSVSDIENRYVETTTTT